MTKVQDYQWQKDGLTSDSRKQRLIIILFVCQMLPVPLTWGNFLSISEKEIILCNVDITKKSNCVYTICSSKAFTCCHMIICTCYTGHTLDLLTGLVFHTKYGYPLSCQWSCINILTCCHKFYNRTISITTQKGTYMYYKWWTVWWDHSLTNNSFWYYKKLCMTEFDR